MASPPNAPGTQSQISISSSHHPDQSIHGQDIPLETLVSYLLASKRSLSSISTVYRANEIVTSAKNALEESVILHARTGYMQSGINEQAKILLSVRDNVEAVYNDGQKEFNVSCEVMVLMSGADHVIRRMSYILSMPQILDWSLRWMC